MGCAKERFDFDAGFVGAGGEVGERDFVAARTDGEGGEVAGDLGEGGEDFDEGGGEGGDGDGLGVDIGWCHRFGAALLGQCKEVEKILPIEMLYDDVEGLDLCNSKQVNTSSSLKNRKKGGWTALFIPHFPSELSVVGAKAIKACPPTPPIVIIGDYVPPSALHQDLHHRLQIYMSHPRLHHSRFYFQGEFEELKKN